MRFRGWQPDVRLHPEQGRYLWLADRQHLPWSHLGLQNGWTINESTQKISTVKKTPFNLFVWEIVFFFFILYFIIYYISYIFFISGHSLRNYRPGSYIMRVTSRPFNPAHAYCIRFFYKAETRQNTAGKLNVYLQVMPY